MNTALETRQETRIVDYRLTDQAIQALSDQYLVLVVTDVEDADQVSVVHDARLDIKDRRVKVEKQRKALKAESLAFGKKVDGAAKHIFGLLEPIESHLQAEEDKVKLAEDAKKAEEAEALRVETDRRRDALKEYNVVLPEIKISTMDEIEFDNALFDAEQDWEEAKRVRDEQEEKRKAEEKRLADQKADQDAEAKRLADVAKHAKEAREAEEAILAKERASIAEQLKALDDEKKRNAASMAKIQADQDARLEAEQDAKDKATREATAKKEAEETALKAKEREEEMRPDKANMAVWIEALRHDVENTKKPHVSNAASEALVCRITDRLTQAIKYSRDEIEEL